MGLIDMELLGIDIDGWHLLQAYCDSVQGAWENNRSTEPTSFFRFYLEWNICDVGNPFVSEVCFF